MGLRMIPQGRHYEHVVTRAAQQAHLLKKKRWKKTYLEILQTYSKIFYIKVIGHVVMGNHVHLVLEVEVPEFDLEDVSNRFENWNASIVNKRIFREEMAEEYYKRFISLSEFMKMVNWRFAIEYNDKNNKSGHFWQGRFKNIVVEDGFELLKVLTYVALNPVRAGMVTDPADFPYSSIADLKRAMDEGRCEKTPEIGMVKNLSDQMRATVYLDWVRYAALAEKDPDLRAQGMPIRFTEVGLELDMEKVWKEFKLKVPVEWSNRVYGSTAFRKEIYERAGWRYRSPRKKKAQAA